MSEENVAVIRDLWDAYACFRARGRGGGVEVRARLHEVYTMRNRKILRVDEFGERAHALEAAGLRE
jgi:ketosteroid isomerase-like protein